MGINNNELHVLFFMYVCEKFLREAFIQKLVEKESVCQNM